jgi:transcriptional regulator with XRE-family HTH domain
MGNVYRADYQYLLIRLRMARQESGLTQSEVGKRLGKTQSYVNKIETGERRMDIVQLMDFCKALEIDFITFIRHYYDTLNGI